MTPASPSLPLRRLALVAPCLAFALSSCTKKTTVSIVESLEVTELEKTTEITEYEATLEPRGKSDGGDSIGWSVRRITPDGKGASDLEDAVMAAKRRMELGMVLLPNRCIRLGTGIGALRQSLAAEAISELGGKWDEQKQMAQSLIGNYLAMDPQVSSLMALAPADLIMLSGIAAGHHDSLRMAHPYYAGVSLPFTIDLRPEGDGIEGSVVLDSNAYADAPEEYRRQLGHVGRFIHRNLDPAHLELTVVDTFIVPESPFSREEKRILKRIYRADLPLL